MKKISLFIIVAILMLSVSVTANAEGAGISVYTLYNRGENSHVEFTKRAYYDAGMDALKLPAKTSAWFDTTRESVPAGRYVVKACVLSATDGNKITGKLASVMPSEMSEIPDINELSVYPWENFTSGADACSYDSAAAVPNQGWESAEELLIGITDITAEKDIVVVYNGSSNTMLVQKVTLTPVNSAEASLESGVEIACMTGVTNPAGITGKPDNARAEGDKFSAMANDGYSINVYSANGGKYLVRALTGIFIGDGNYDISVNACKQITAVSAGVLRERSYINLGEIALNQGNNTIYLKHTPLKENAFIRLYRVYIEYIGEQAHVSIGGEEYAEDGRYSRGSDVISVMYSGDIDVDSTLVTLTDEDNKKIGLIANVDSNNPKHLIISLIDSLSYNKEYRLSLSGVQYKYDNHLFPVNAQDIQFFTRTETEENAGKGTVVIDNFVIKNGVASLEGFTYSSVGMGISGRRLTLYITLPDGTKVLAADHIKSGADGKFSLSYPLENDNIKGTVTAEVNAEYSSAVTKECYYVSDTYSLPILKQIKESTLWTEIMDILNTHKDILGIHPDTDLAGLNPQGFYTQFVGACLESANEFRNFYNSMIVLEKINSASNVHDVQTALTDEALDLYEIDKAKITVLGTSVDIFYNVLLNIPKPIMGKKAFTEAFDSAFNTALMAKENVSDISLADNSYFCKEGAVLTLSLAGTEEYANIKRIALQLTFKGALDYAEEVTVTSDAGTVTTNKEGNLYTVIVETDATIPFLKTIARLSLVCARPGAGSIQVSGKAISATSTGYDASLGISEKAFEVTVAEQSKKPTGGGSSGGGSEKRNIIVPESVKDPSVGVTEIYTDLSDAKWAEEAIIGLYNLQVINQNEEAKFYPMRGITRAEFVKMVTLAYSLARAEDVRKEAAAVTFGDVNEQDWYFQYVQAALYSKLITGDENGNFRPNDVISREELCTILARYLGLTDTIPENAFADDAAISDYAKSAVYAMRKRQIVNGIGDNLFAPKAKATRAEAAKIIFGTLSQR